MERLPGCRAEYYSKRSFINGLFGDEGWPWLLPSAGRLCGDRHDQQTVDDRSGKVLDKLLHELTDASHPLKASQLLLLSGLVTDELEQLRSRWGQVAPERRYELVSKLVEMGEDSTDLDFYTVLSFCIDDQDPRVRKQAIAGLWECEDRSLIPPLIKRVTHDDDVEVRATAAMALGQFALLAQQGKLLARDGEKVYNTLLEILRNPDEALVVRRRALESAGAFESEEVKRWVVWGYKNSEDVLRQSALCAMGHSCDNSWLPILVSEMASDDPAIRFEAANACRELGDEAAVPHLASLVNDDDPEVQMSAIYALGVIGGATARGFLRTYANAANDGTVREAIELALVQAEAEEHPLRFKPTW